MATSLTGATSPALSSKREHRRWPWMTGPRCWKKGHLDRCAAQLTRGPGHRAGPRRRPSPGQARFWATQTESRPTDTQPAREGPARPASSWTSTRLALCKATMSSGWGHTAPSNKPGAQGRGADPQEGSGGAELEGPTVGADSRSQSPAMLQGMKEQVGLRAQGPRLGAYPQEGPRRGVWAGRATGCRPWGVSLAAAWVWRSRWSPVQTDRNLQAGFSCVQRKALPAQERWGTGSGR
jgi:hypothetical protein